MRMARLSPAREEEATGALVTTAVVVASPAAVGGVAAGSLLLGTSLAMSRPMAAIACGVHVMAHARPIYPPCIAPARKQRRPASVDKRDAPERAATAAMQHTWRRWRRYIKETPPIKKLIAATDDPSSKR